MNSEVKDIEIFMMAQFIDVMNAIDKYEKIEEVKQDIKNRREIYNEYIRKMDNTKDFLSLNLYNKDIDAKIEKCSELYSTSKEYKMTLKKLKEKYKKLEEKLINKDKEMLEEIKTLINELCHFDVHLAYKIGLVEGMKVKNKCT